MALVKLVEYADASPEVRAVYDDIMTTRKVKAVNNFWKVIATYPQLLRQTWEMVKSALRPGRIDPLTKEMIAIAVSATNNCAYCLHSHTAAAQKLGLDEEMLGELYTVIAAFNATNRIANGYQLEPDVTPTYPR